MGDGFATRGGAKENPRSYRTSLKIKSGSSLSGMAMAQCREPSARDGTMRGGTQYDTEKDSLGTLY